MKVITISNHKGGCGKTTTSVNMSAYIAQHKKHVLLIDLDPQGATTSGFGIDKKTIERHMVDVMLGSATLEEIIHSSAIPNLDIAPCNINLVSAESHLAGQPGKEFVLKEKLEYLTTTGNPYDYVVIDTPPNMGALTLNGLVACDDLIIPIQCEYYALEGVEQLEYILKLLSKRFGRKPAIRVLLTMYDPRTNLSKEVIQDVRSHFKDCVFKTIIPRNVKLAEAPANGACIHTHAPHSPGALAYKALAEEVLL